MDRLESDVLNHHKHIHGLILWLKSHAGCALIKDGDHEHVDSEFYYVSGDAFDLCNMFSEGSTVAHEIWKRYEGDWSPSKEESPAKAQNSAMPKLLEDMKAYLSPLTDVSQKEWRSAVRRWVKQLSA